VKKRSKAKMRLSGVLTQKQREAFTLAMLEDVLKAVKASKVSNIVLVSSDEEVKKLAEKFEVTYLEDSEHEINKAVKLATEWCLANNADCILVLPADVPLVTAQDVNSILELASKTNLMVVSPSGTGGTNALLLSPPDLVLTRFGAESFEEHKKEATKAGAMVRVFRSERVALDVDVFEDLEKLRKSEADTVSGRFLQKTRQ
jgi:2-phospho-L-lactate guanylyltransferase